MADQGQPWELLGFPGRAVNALRDALASANVEPPAWLVQIVVLLIAFVLILVFARLLKTNANPLARAFNGTGLVVAVAILAGILWSWTDHMFNPPSGQIVGTLSGAPADRAQIEILDYRDRNVAVVDVISGSDRFVATYEPLFADPPKAIRAQAEGCDETRHGLTRRHLQFGTPLSLFLSCSGG